MTSADPINPQRIFWELSPLLPDNVIMTGDSGSVANWYARDIKIRRGMMGSLSGGLASLGAATPYAVAAKMAYPERPVIGFIGDGAMQMNGLNVMITVGKYWREWIRPALHHHGAQQRGPEPGDLGESACNSATARRRRPRPFPNFPYHKYAELIGLKGIYCDDPDQISAAWKEALAADRPGDHRVQGRPQRAAAAAAHHVQGREELHDDDGRRAGT